MEAATGAGADAGVGDGGSKMALSGTGTGTADEHGIALVLEERASGQVTHQSLIDWRVAKIESRTAPWLAAGERWRPDI
jgi:hypothetical protein